MVAFLLSYTSTLSSDHKASIGVTEALIWQEVLLAFALMYVYSFVIYKPPFESCNEEPY